MPHAYTFAGQLIILPRNKVRKIDKITSGEAMKYAITGGVVDLDAERVQNPDVEIKEEIKSPELLQEKQL